MAYDSTASALVGSVCGSPCTFMTNTAITGATFDIDGGQQIVEA